MNTENGLYETERPWNPGDLRSVLWTGNDPNQTLETALDANSKRFLFQRAGTQLVTHAGAEELSPECSEIQVYKG